MACGCNKKITDRVQEAKKDKKDSKDVQLQQPKWCSKKLSKKEKNRRAN